MTPSARWKTLAFFVVIHAAAMSAQATEIRLRAKAYAQGSLVLLSDVAAVSGPDAAAVQALGRIELFPAPSEHRARSVRLREIRELLALHGVDLSGCRFTGAPTVHVYQRRTPPAVRVPPRGTSEAAEANAHRLVVVATRAIPRGRIVRPADVVVQPWPATGAASAALRQVAVVEQLDEALGREATRDLAAGEPIDARALRRPLLVRRGEIITVTSRAPGVSVRTTARAVEDAAQGELILVESLANRKRFTARVTAAQEAEVYASGNRVSDPQARQAGRFITPRKLEAEAN